MSKRHRNIISGFFVIINTVIFLTDNKKLKFIINCVYYGITVLAVFFAAKYALMYLLPFVIGFTIVFILQKPALYLNKKTKINKNFLTFVMLLAAAGAIFCILFFTVKSILLPLYDYFCATDIIGNTRRSIEDFCSFLPNNSIPLGENTADAVCKYISEFIFSALQKTVTEIPEFLLNTVLAAVATVFFAIYYDDFICFVKKQLTDKTTEFIKKIKYTVNNSIFCYVKGYLIMLAITFSEMLLGLRLLKIDNAATIAAIIAFVDLLPVFGTGTVLIPWGIISILNNNFSLGTGLLVLYGIYAVLRYFTEPKVIGKKVGINPLVSLVSMIAGLRLFGFAGLFVLPLICAVLNVLNENKVINLWK